MSKRGTRHSMVTENFIKIVAGVMKYFDNDARKTKIWLTTPNLNFGGLSPLKIISTGRAHRVLEFIATAEFENQPPREPREWKIRGADARGGIWNAEGPQMDELETVLVREVIQ